MIYTNQGWHDEKFLLGNKLYGVGAYERVNLSPECARVGGEIRTFKGFEQWGALSDSLFAAGNEARGFVLLAGFATPLMGLLEDGGITVALISEQKHQLDMLYAAVHSIYGKQKCLHISRANPYDIKFAILHACGNLPCIHPELFATDPSVSIRFMEDTIEQNTMLLTGYKVSIPAELTDRPKPPTHYEKRVLEIYLPISDPKRDAELTAMYHNHFGTAGARFIRYISSNRGYFREKLKEYRVSVGNLMGGRDSERLACNLIASVGLAARICEKIGVLHASPDRMMEFAKSALESQRARDYQAVHEPELTLRDYLMSHLDSILVLYGDAHGRKRETIVWDTQSPTTIRYEILARNMLVSVPAFVKWCAGRHQQGHRIIRELYALGVVKEKSTQNSLRSGHPLVRLRPNPRGTTMELNPDHPVIAPHIDRLEKELKIEHTSSGPLVPGYAAPKPEKPYQGPKKPRPQVRPVDYSDPPD